MSEENTPVAPAAAPAEQVAAPETAPTSVSEAIKASAAAAEQQVAPAEKFPGENAPVKTPVRPARIKKDKPARKTPTDDEVKAKWAKTLSEAGWDPEGPFVKTITDYATKHRGFDARRSWGGVLISMFVRAHEQLSALDRFDTGDSDALFTELQKFLMEMENVVGTGPAEWNVGLPNNSMQREVIDNFFGIGGRLSAIPTAKFPIMAIRRAAWPSRVEGEKMIGGSFMDRFVYLVMALVNVLTLEDVGADFLSTSLHERVIRKPSWVAEDNTCKDCHSPVTQDANGRWRCTSLCCPNRFAPAEGLPESFGHGGAPAAAARPQRQFNDGKSNRKSRSEDDENDRRFRQKNGKKGKKYRTRDDGEDFESQHDDGGEPRVVTSIGQQPAGGFGSLGDVLGDVMSQLDPKGAGDAQA